jgi:hypothetical protein
VPQHDGVWDNRRGEIGCGRRYLGHCKLGKQACEGGIVPWRRAREGPGGGHG